MRPSNHLLHCSPLLLLPSIFPSIRVFSSESALYIRWTKYWSFSFSISSSNEYLGLISFRIDWLDLLAVQGSLKSFSQPQSSKASIRWHSPFFMVQPSIHTQLLEKPQHSIVFLYFFALFTTLHSDGYIFPFLLCLLLVFFPQLFVRPPQTTILLFCIFLFVTILIIVSCTMLQTSVHSSSGFLSIRSNPLNLFVTSTI